MNTIVRTILALAVLLAGVTGTVAAQEAQTVDGDETKTKVDVAVATEDVVLFCRIVEVRPGQPDVGECRIATDVEPV